MNSDRCRAESARVEKVECHERFNLVFTACPLRQLDRCYGLFIVLSFWPDSPREKRLAVRHLNAGCPVAWQRAFKAEGRRVKVSRMKNGFIEPVTLP